MVLLLVFTFVLLIPSPGLAETVGNPETGLATAPLVSEGPLSPAPSAPAKAESQPAAAPIQEATPDTWAILTSKGEHLRKIIYEKSGLFGLIVLALVGVLGGLWWKWRTIEKLPGMQTVLSWLYAKTLWRKSPLPRPEGGRFAVAMAHIENDPDGKNEEHLVEALRDFEGIQVLRFDRTIPLAEHPDPEEAERSGHELARTYLHESGADALIWGIYIKNLEAPRFYWTTASDGRRSHHALPLENLRLPELVMADLVEVLQPLITGIRQNCLKTLPIPHYQGKMTS